MTETKWFDRSGVPIESTTYYASDGETIIGQSNPEQPGDIEIDETTYDSMVAAAQSSADATIAAAIAATQALRDSAKTKLMSGTPLTEDEAIIITA